MAEYLALGSSFAAGPGLEPRASSSPRSAGRSASNYAHILSARFDLELDDQSFSGATIAQIAGLEVAPRQAQVLALRASTRLVTITGGGNDVGYLPRLTLDSLPVPLRALFKGKVARLGDLRTNDHAFEALQKDLSALIRTIRDSSEALVVVTDYLTILPPNEDVVLSPLSAEVTEWGRRTAARLTQTLSEVSQEENAIFVQLADLSREHHAWAEEPWTRRFHLSLRGGAPYHPTVEGMAAAAAAIASNIQDQFPFT